MIPTAQEFYEQKRLLGETEDITGNPNPDYNNRFYGEIFDLMDEYSTLKAKHYVTEALKQASEQAETDYELDNPYDPNSTHTIIDKQSILSAYPLELIK